MHTPFASLYSIERESLPHKNFWGLHFIDCVEPEIRYLLAFRKLEDIHPGRLKQNPHEQFKIDWYCVKGSKIYSDVSYLTGKPFEEAIKEAIDALIYELRSAPLEKYRPNQTLCYGSDIGPLIQELTDWVDQETQTLPLKETS